MPLSWATLVALRRDFHAHPEPGFSETRTRATIITYLTTVSKIPYSTVTKHPPLATTGLIVDVHGTAPATPTPRGIMLRADMDALTMTEANIDLPYKSTTPGLAHMCGE